MVHSPAGASPATTQPFVFHVTFEELKIALVRGLRGNATGPVVWVDGDSEVVVYPARTQLALKPGWLLVQLALETDQTGEASLTIPLAVGDKAATASLVAITEEQTRGNPVLASRWGQIAQELVWDAILRAGQDVLDREAKRQLRLVGVYTDGKRLSYLAAPPVTVEQIARYYVEVRDAGDALPDYNPQPIDLFPDIPLPHIERLVLVDTRTRKPIDNHEDLRDGVVLDLSRLPPHFTILALTRPDEVGSVVFDISDDDGYRVENQAPYLLMGNAGEEYFAWSPAPGDYVVRATPYTQADAQGQVGHALTVRLRVIRAQKMTITRFSLMNADTNKPIDGFDPLQQNTVINLSELPTRNLNIVAHTDPQVVGSVVFGLNDNPQHQVERDPPYALFSDKQGDLNPWTPAPRTYRVTATPYDGDYGTGVAGETATVSFAVIDKPAHAVVSFTLIDADKDQPIPEFNPLPDGVTLDLSQLPTRNLNLRANTHPDKVSGVRFSLNDIENFHDDTRFPYSLLGDRAGDYLPHVFDRDKYVVIATPYLIRKREQEEGESLTITFFVMDREPALAVINFTLLNAQTGEPVPGYDPIPAKAEIDNRKLPHPRITMRANLNTDKAGSVVFSLGTQDKFKVENSAPYTLFGELNNGLPDGRPFKPGIYRITATPYTGSDGQGEAGVAETIEFRVVR